jgi:hypothetical protein
VWAEEDTKWRSGEICVRCWWFLSSLSLLESDGFVVSFIVVDTMLVIALGCFDGPAEAAGGVGR